jgi:hypothetical protein
MRCKFFPSTMKNRLVNPVCLPEADVGRVSGDKMPLGDDALHPSCHSVTVVGPGNTDFPLERIAERALRRIAELPRYESEAGSAIEQGALS